MIELINYNVRNKIDKIKYWTKIANVRPEYCSNCCIIQQSSAHREGKKQ